MEVILWIQTIVLVSNQATVAVAPVPPTANFVQIPSDSALFRNIFLHPMLICHNGDRLSWRQISLLPHLFQSLKVAYSV